MEQQLFPICPNKVGAFSHITLVLIGACRHPHTGKKRPVALVSPPTYAPTPDCLCESHKRDAPPQLHLRRLDTLQATELPGTTDARDPFFSPDGRWVAFFADGKLKKISVSGGAAVAFPVVRLLDDALPAGVRVLRRQLPRAG